MKGEDIRIALRQKCRIVHNDPKSQTQIIYDYAQAWRVSVDMYGEFISSLELVKGGSVTVALANQCEFMR